MSQRTATLRAGVPAHNLSLYRSLRFDVHDPVAFIELPDGVTQVIMRDIELDRARREARGDRFHAPADFAPEGGLSGDRETATAQATAECLRRANVERVVTDRALPMIYAHFISRTGLEVVCDVELGVLERRAKDEEEVAHLRRAQRITEQCVEMACVTVATATAADDGTLMMESEPLTSERVRALIDAWLLERNFDNSVGSIVACGPDNWDCHYRGVGTLRTGAPVIIDVFPRDKASLYCGDCTRTVVHGDISDDLRAMHEAILEAKRLALAACRVGVTGGEVHRATVDALEARGYAMGLHEGPDDERVRMPHGTGHGVGLEVHEPPLLDRGGPPLVAGDCLTVEPGLYGRTIGGMRVEDMVIVQSDGEPENLNTISEALEWA